MVIFFFWIIKLKLSLDFSKALSKMAHSACSSLSVVDDKTESFDSEEDLERKIVELS